MKRVFAPAFAALIALAGCATTPYPSVQRFPPRPLPAPTHSYASAPRAPLLSELFVCGRDGANLGAIGERGEAADYTPYIFTPAGPLLRAPTEGACLSSGFGWRGTADGGGREHTGLDLANPNGSFIFAAASGRVVWAGERGAYGFVVELDHGADVHTLYGHLAEINPALQPGAGVEAGQAIGFMGATGNASGVHLHYEVIVDGLKVDPLHYGVEAPVS